VDAIIETILEMRRQDWCELLTLNAMWLKESKKAHLPWHQMFHLAEAVADSTLELVDITLMESIAIQSLMACLSRREEGR